MSLFDSQNISLGPKHLLIPQRNADFEVTLARNQDIYLIKKQPHITAALNIPEYTRCSKSFNEHSAEDHR